MNVTQDAKSTATGKKPNIVFFLWDNLAWGEVGCYGGGVLRGAPTPREAASSKAVSYGAPFCRNVGEPGPTKR
jgi:arylsulfatase A-like enzyme